VNESRQHKGPVKLSNMSCITVLVGRQSIRSIHSKSFLRVPFHQFYMKLLSVIAPTQSSMDLLRGMDDNYKKGTIKARATIPMAGAIITAAILLSGLSLIGSHQQPVLAQQQNMTGGAGNATNATMTGGAGNATNATMTGTNGSAPMNSSPSANSLTGGTTTGEGATAGGGVGTFGGSGGGSPDPGIGTTEGGNGGGPTTGGGDASGGVPDTTGGAAGPQVRP
jgi:hypothetical protein